ncbi:MAG TPA: hypothetical protein VMV77_10965 [Bacteroidales bacterium]|nr:hypothetical protein [Bacteroidales bacterium]
MDHIVCLDTKTKELENLVNGNKSMIIRGAAGRKLPHGRVNEGDVLYFINNNGDGEVKARGVVSSVLNSDQLSVEESFETIIRHQDKLQLPDKQFEKLAGKRYLVLIGLNDIEEIEPFRIDRSILINMDGWITIDKIEKVALRPS